MGRIKTYGFTKVLYLGMNDEIPDFDDDTLVIAVDDSHPFRGEIRPFNGFMEED